MSKINYVVIGAALLGLTGALYRQSRLITALIEDSQSLRKKQREQFEDLQMMMVDENTLEHLREKFKASEAPYSWSRGKRW